MSSPNSSYSLTWKDRPTFLVHLPLTLLCVFFFWLIIPLLILGWAYLSNRAISYEATKEQLYVRSGVLNKKIDWLELYRVKDIRTEKPFVLRLLAKGRGNIVLMTSDRSDPIVVLKGIENPELVSRILREKVEKMRVERGVREFD